MRLPRLLKQSESNAGAAARHRLKVNRATRRAALLSAILGAGLAFVSGCDIKSFIDPSEMFYDTKKPIQLPILSSISYFDPSIDDPDDQFYNATEVKDEDRLVQAQDYRIGVGDSVEIVVNDLMGVGVQTNKLSRVSESGFISLPLIGQVKALGLTEAGLESAIHDTYREKNIVTDAQITVTVQERRNATYSVLGAVGNPGEFPLLRADTRMYEAMTTFRDVLQNVDTVYVIRRVEEDPHSGPTAGHAPSNMVTPTKPPSNPGAGDPISPHVTEPMPQLDRAAYLMQTPPETTGGTLTPTPTPTGTPLAGAGAQPFQFAAPTDAAETRTIRVPLKSLRMGDQRYNIVIRPHDIIIAPLPTTGFYYMGGHVARTGVYTLSGQSITIKQAVIASGMLDPVAIPQRTELVRRVGTAREAMVRVNIDAIFSGTQPDIYLKPNDVLQVGTNILAPFIQDLRTGFRITYGFGFLYDRNYAPQQTTGG